VEHFKLDADELGTRHEEAATAWERGEIDLDKYLDARYFMRHAAFCATSSSSSCRRNETPRGTYGNEPLDATQE
jgi:hypothetical protein